MRKLYAFFLGILIVNSGCVITTYDYIQAAKRCRGNVPAKGNLRAVKRYAHKIHTALHTLKCSSKECKQHVHYGKLLIIAMTTSANKLMWEEEYHYQCLGELVNRTTYHSPAATEQKEQWQERTRLWFKKRDWLMRKARYLCLQVCGAQCRPKPPNECFCNTKCDSKRIAF